MTVAVYFESVNHAELVAFFDDEQTYIACLPALTRKARETGMKVTESMDVDSVRDLLKEQASVMERRRLKWRYTETGALYSDAGIVEHLRAGGDELYNEAGDEFLIQEAYQHGLIELID